eukprot:scaffold111548_cov20-Tisochrysis_lutea.AAC.1
MLLRCIITVWLYAEGRRHKEQTLLQYDLCSVCAALWELTAERVTQRKRAGGDRQRQNGLKHLFSQALRLLFEMHSLSSH